MFYKTTIQYDITEEILHCHNVPEQTFHHLSILKWTFHRHHSSPEQTVHLCDVLKQKWSRKEIIPSQYSNTQNTIATFQNIWLVVMFKQYYIVICQKKTFKQYHMSKSALVLNISMDACQVPQVFRYLWILFMKNIHAPDCV